MKLKISYQKLAEKTNTKQPLRWKFAQTLKQLSVQYPTLIAYKKCVHGKSTCHKYKKI